ncbi:MAG: hypothetical protein KJN71_10190, partial [Acidimicrobiia bacterium]|nr:hypothetical protein [Acidimicrobiia bacterium]
EFTERYLAQQALEHEYDPVELMPAAPQPTLSVGEVASIETIGDDAQSDLTQTTSKPPSQNP